MMTQERLQLAKHDLLLLAPGPINRGVELTPEVADGTHSAILDQVTNGLAVRMAVLYLLGRPEQEPAPGRKSRDVFEPTTIDLGCHRGDVPCGPFRSRGGRIIDPEPGPRPDRRPLDQPRADPADAAAGYEEAEIVIDARGMIVCPGLIDIHVHLREPGNEEDETIATGRERRPGRRRDLGRLHAQHHPGDRYPGRRRVRRAPGPAGAAGQRLSRSAPSARAGKGEELAELGQLVAGGAVAFTDDGAPVASAALMRRALAIRQDVRPRDHAALPGARADRRRRDERGVRVDAAGAWRACRPRPKTSWSPATSAWPRSPAAGCTSSTSRRPARSSWSARASAGASA